MISVCQRPGRNWVSIALVAGAVAFAPASGDRNVAEARDIGCIPFRGRIVLALRFVKRKYGEDFQKVCVRVTSPDRLAKIYGNGAMSADLPELGGEYLPDSGVIYLSDRLDLGNVADLGFLVHELVHAHQDRSGAFESTPTGLLEYQAYATQAEFLRQQGEGRAAFLVELLGLLQGSSDLDYRE